jgi:hypothetical protein
MDVFDQLLSDLSQESCIFCRHGGETGIYCNAQVKAWPSLREKLQVDNPVAQRLSFKDEHLPVGCLREPERPHLFLLDG